MKKLIFTMAILLVSTMGFAQIQKGDVQINGNVSFQKVNNAGTEISSFSLLPKAGVFVSETTSLGGIIGYTSRDFNGENSNEFNIGAYARFHKPMVENFYLYLEPSLTFGFGSREVGGADADLNSFDIRLAPGMTYFLSPKFALDMNWGMLNYSKETTKLGNAETENENYGLNLNMTNVSMGVSFYIR
ncbi:outer membrane beta-barrel protein [Roseivirga echinicomitans]|uniref:Outer membrane protein beta-barrel domain-containing protein n=1 Tax=Roseivirga echinicomitans TaxID=296218 RepID=A0A150X1N2_9BACT|nr:outer membrane beta-barrel protein [Roseivirga echinicomitans]KYG72472.1 hypothetical protein AWN68_11985 [Roseivirga echinicomitans]